MSQLYNVLTASGEQKDIEIKMNSDDENPQINLHYSDATRADIMTALLSSQGSMINVGLLPDIEPLPQDSFITEDKGPMFLKGPDTSLMEMFAEKQHPERPQNCRTIDLPTWDILLIRLKSSSYFSIKIWIFVQTLQENQIVELFRKSPRTAGIILTGHEIFKETQESVWKSCGEPKGLNFKMFVDGCDSALSVASIFKFAFTSHAKHFKNIIKSNKKSYDKIQYNIYGNIVARSCSHLGPWSVLDKPTEEDKIKLIKSIELCIYCSSNGSPFHQRETIAQTMVMLNRFRKHYPNERDDLVDLMNKKLKMHSNTQWD